MKRLVPLPLDPEQHEDLARVLDEARIDWREVKSPSRLFSSDAIWVADEDFVRARELLRQQSEAFAAKRRSEWQAEWTSEHAESYARWLWRRMRENPAGLLLKLAALIVLAGLLLLFPMMFVFQ